MRDKEKSRKLYWVAVSDVSDYFRKLGGSGRYNSYTEWHSFAFAAVVAAGISIDGDSEMLEDIIRRTTLSLGRIFEINELIKYAKPNIEELNCSLDDVSDFVFEMNTHLIKKSLKLSSINNLERHDLQALMDWGAFYYTMFNSVLPSLRANKQDDV